MTSAVAAGRIAEAAGRLPQWRPALGGPAPTPGSGVSWTDPGAATGSVDVGLLLLVAIGLFAVIGYWIGLDRAARALLVAAAAFVVLDRQWPFVARWINHLYRLFVFAIVRRGILADDPSTVWKTMGDVTGPLPVGDGAHAWQVALYSGILVLGYLLADATGRAPSAPPGRILDGGNLASRLVGAALGAITGAIVGWFVLERLLPGAGQGALALGPATGGILSRVGPLAILGVVVLVLVFGVLTMGGRRKKMYG